MAGIDTEWQVVGAKKGKIKRATARIPTGLKQKVDSAKAVHALLHRDETSSNFAFSVSRSEMKKRVARWDTDALLQPCPNSQGLDSERDPNPSHPAGRLDQRCCHSANFRGCPAYRPAPGAPRCSIASPTNARERHCYATWHFPRHAASAVDTGGKSQCWRMDRNLSRLTFMTRILILP